MSSLLGALAALYLLSGRWALTRLAEGAERAAWLEVRPWVVAALALGALLARSRGGRRPVAIVSGSAALLFLWLLATAMWAPDPDLAARKVWEVALVLVATLAIGRAVACDPAGRFLSGFWAAVLVLGGGLAALALPAVARGGAGERLAVLAGGPNVFARIVGLLALAALFFWRRQGRAWLWMPVVAIAFVLVLLTGSRGGLVSLALAVAVFLALELRDPRRLLPAVAVAAALFVAVATGTRAGRAALDAYEQRVAVLLIEERYTAGRGELYAAAWALGLEAPVAGNGLAAFPARGLGVYPHNLFLEVFCEAGILGLALLALALASGAAAALRRGAARDGATLAALVLVFVSSQFSGDLYDSRGVFALLVVAAAARGQGEPKSSFAFSAALP